MSSVRVKICGLTNVDDALHACAAGADAIGLVFYAKSARFVDLTQAAEIAASIPPFVQRVGLFVNETEAFVNNVLVNVELDLLQFHGDETAEYCQSFSLPYIKALRMKPGQDIGSLMSQHPRARAFLLDSYTPGIPGGTGETFNWSEFPSSTDKPLILAGGLKPENIQIAINSCLPYAVDVSGGVESKPGRKSAEKVQAFIRQAKKIEVIS